MPWSVTMRTTGLRPMTAQRTSVIFMGRGLSFAGVLGPASVAERGRRPRIARAGPRHDDAARLATALGRPTRRSAWVRRWRARLPDGLGGDRSGAPGSTAADLAGRPRGAVVWRR